MDEEFLFVYGTLRKLAFCNMNHILAHHSEYCGTGYMQGVLYEVDGYPGAVELQNPNDRVHGELYLLLNSESVLPVLDDYEECSAKFPTPHEYTRKQLPISLPDGNSQQAWVYVYNYEVSNLERVKSGDYAIAGFDKGHIALSNGFGKTQK